MTAQHFEKLTRVILISIAVALAACLAWELRAATFEYLVERERESLREQKQAWGEIVRRNLGLNRNESEFENSLTSDKGPTPDVW